MTQLKEIYSKDTDIEADHNSWTSLPAGFLLLIKDTSESPNLGLEYYLLIDDDGNRLLIE